jgi:N-acetyl-D-muramate 6-phosphate phosphatase
MGETLVSAWTGRENAVAATGAHHRPHWSMALVAVFDLDGTLLDSDEALVGAFVALGVDRAAVSFGHVLETECQRLGIELDDYLEAYDETEAQPFPGATELLAGLDRWAVCSNKHPRAGRAELARLEWVPEVALFNDAFDGPKRLPPVLEALGLAPHEVVFVGDTAHDRVCAQEVGARFALAGWNPRTRPAPGDLVLGRPQDLLAVLDGGGAG